MVGYKALEQAILRQLLIHFSDELDENRARAGDIDTVLDSLFNSGSLHGCVLEAGGGRIGNDDSFERNAWVWTVHGYYMLRYTDAIDFEGLCRDVMTRLSQLFNDDPRLNKTTPRARMMRVEAPEPVQINDIPFYWITFVMEVIDRD